MVKSKKSRHATKDFQKVKIKVGKGKLKKAQNETKTAFKARKIVLKEQLKDKSDEVLITKRKHNIKELLSRLGHQSVFVRQDGVNGIKELLNANSLELITVHMPVIMPRLAAVVQDIDSTLRSSAINLIELFITKAGDARIEPYFNLLCSHVSCAMVHLNSAVQSDSLKLMDVLITNTPSLIATRANSLLTNFINLISRKSTSMNSAAAASSSSAPAKVDFSRILLMSPGNKLTSTQWRIKLLRQLGKFLEAIFDEHGRTRSQVPTTTWETIISGFSGGASRWEAGSSVEQVDVLKDEGKLKEFCHAAVPLLFSIWAEVAPSAALGTAANVLNSEAAETLEAVLHITAQLRHFVEICTQQPSSQCVWFKTLVETGLKKSVLSGFPYSRHSSIVDASKKKKSKKKAQAEGALDSLCDNLNLSLAGLAFTVDPTQPRIYSLSEFLSVLLLDSSRDGAYSVESAAELVITLIETASSHEKHSKKLAKDCVVPLIDACRVCFKRLPTHHRHRASLLNVLLTATHIHHLHLNLIKTDPVVSWCDTVAADIASGCLTAGKQGEMAVLTSAASLALRGTAPFVSGACKHISDRKGLTESATVRGMSDAEARRYLRRVVATTA